MKQKYTFLAAFITISFLQHSFAQPFTVDISKPADKILSHHLELGSNRNPDGNTLDANSLYFINNGKPWYPVMGEFHFNRFPKEQWEESILKMKMAGINVIATYVFWIYHEEIEGQWDWSGKRDLRVFVDLCKKHGMYVLVRIGPWCHGEVRNGGFPDWLLQKKLKTRTNDSLYLSYVKTLDAQINKQLTGYYFKDGGTVIGAQIENEFRFNNVKGYEHITTLLKMAKNAGIDVPFYTATSWPGSNIHQNQLIPVWGGYPEAPWDKRTTPLPPSANYLFDSLRVDTNIGNDINGNIKDTNHYSGYRYPYATAEIGGGIQVTYHRRPIIEPKDVLGLAFAKIGSGANLMGYYMFHGGHNSIGQLSTLQESKATAYPNDYPILNYDFQSPLGEWGQLRPSYRYFKTLHLFLNDFGDVLTPCATYFPSQKIKGAADSTILRWSVRSNNGSGFVFINHFQRLVNMQPVKNVQLKLAMPNGKTMLIPQQPITVPAGLQTVWPFNLQMENVLLKYSTAQPLCILHDKNVTTYVFFSADNIAAEYLIDQSMVKSLNTSNTFSYSNSADGYLIKIKHPGLNCLMQLSLTDGKELQILTLTQQQALDSWKINCFGKERLVISADELTVWNNAIRLQNTGDNHFMFDIFPAINNLKLNNIASNGKPNGVFTNFNYSLPLTKFAVDWKEDNSLASALQPAKPQKVKGIDSANFSMPLYGSKLASVPNARYYSVSAAPKLNNNISNVFMQIDYTGDTQAAYLNGQLIADDFYYGKPMAIALKPFYEQLTNQPITLLVTPKPADRQIFVEKTVQQENLNKAAIRNIQLLPQYQIMVTEK